MQTRWIDAADLDYTNVIVSKHMGPLWITELHTLDNGYVKLLVVTEESFHLEMHIDGTSRVNVNAS